MTNVTQLKVAKQKQAPTAKAKSKHHTKRLARQGTMAVCIGLVACTLTTLSLSHLAHGIQIVTGAPEWEGWAMAIVTDIGFVVLELAQVMVTTDKLGKEIQKFTRPAIVGTLVGSAAMNAFAFGSHCTGWMLYPAITMGVAVPALLYCLTRTGAALYIDSSNKA